MHGKTLAVIVCLLTSFLVSVPWTAPGAAFTTSVFHPAAASATSRGVAPLAGPDSWTLLGNQAPPRDYHGFVYDPKVDRFILFGGQIANNVATNSTWSYDYDTNTWTNVSKVVAPSPRSDFGMAYDSIAQRILLFGGVPNDTWAFDPATDTWTQRFPTQSPPRLFSPVMTFDARADRSIMAGLPLPGTSLETWSYDYAANRWSEVNTPSPSNRSGEGMVYDPSAGRDLLFGGFSNSGVPLGDVWSFDYANLTWTNRSPPSPPPGRGGMALAFDAAADRMVMYGGTGSAGNMQVVYEDTWAYDYVGNAWSNLAPASPPSGRYLMAMDYDSAALLEVMCGGYQIPAGFLDEAWSFQLAAVVPPTAPQVFAAMGGLLRVNLTWTPPYLDGGSSVTNYTIYRGTASGAETYLATTGPTPGYTDRAVTVGTTYYYEVAAVNSVGEGAKSTEAHASPLPDTVPPTVAITAPANNSVVTSASITVSGAASDNVGVAKVEASVGGSTWTLAPGTTSWSATLTLTPGNNTVYARATDTSGNVRTTMITVTLQSTSTSPSALDPIVLVAVVVVVAVVVLAVALALRRRSKKPEQPPPPP